MANEKEVKAQVRLRFWNVNRQRMTATRNLQVTMKKGGALTMKTLEGILAKTDVDGGEGKVSSEIISCHASFAGRKADGKAEYDIYKVLRDG
jgi:DNA repair protein RAD50